MSIFAYFNDHIYHYIWYVYTFIGYFYASRGKGVMKLQCLVISYAIFLIKQRRWVKKILKIYLRIV